MVFPWFWLTVVNRFPASGDFRQDIEPRTYWDLPFSGPYRGDPPLERRILAEGAGYGEQLNAILDALAVLTGEEDGTDGAAFARIKKLREEIDDVKLRHREDAGWRARRALQSLKHSVPREYERLVRSLADEISRERQG